MITFEIKLKSHVVFFVFLENKEENKEFTIEIFGAKKALFRTLHFFLESPWGFLWCWVRQQTNQWKGATIDTKTICSAWYQKGNPTEKEQKGAELLPFVTSTPQMNKNMQNESNKKKTNETMVILFAVSIKKKQH